MCHRDGSHVYARLSPLSGGGRWSRVESLLVGVVRMGLSSETRREVTKRLAKLTRLLSQGNSQHT